MWINGGMKVNMQKKHIRIDRSIGKDTLLEDTCPKILVSEEFAEVM